MALKEFFKTAFQTNLAALFAAGKDKEKTLGELEELLILADISLPAVEEIIAQLRKKAKSTSGKEDFNELLRRELLALFAGTQRSPLAGGGKNVILLVGVNGSGKTTSAAKLARHYQKQGQSVLLAAADTFRAAGSTQLSLWGQKLDIPVVSGERGADPGSVVFNSLQSWQNKNFDLLIIDTAGRMQSKDNLMKELEKIVKIIKKFAADQPAETWLVLDASTGQNALVQAEKFRQFSGINGMVLAKLDGTAKGGTIISIASQLKLPVFFTGTGETENDLWEFSEKEFIASLLGQ